MFLVVCAHDDLATHRAAWDGADEASGGRGGHGVWGQMEKEALSIKELRSPRVGKRTRVIRVRVRQKYDEEDFPNVDLKNT